MADPAEIIDEVEALTAHCRPPVMSVETRARWVQDWAKDLAKYPLADIQAVFRQWRQGESLKFPTPGQILPMLDRMGGNKTTQAIPVWSYDISDGDYRALSLSDKIRHHKLAATHCRQKAGPMPHLGKPVPREDMPNAWHEWQRKAQNHEAEAVRLKQSIGSRDQRA